MDAYDAVARTKIPTSMDNYLGIEVEFISKWDRDDIEDLLIKHGLEHSVQLTEDGSVHSIEEKHDDDCEGSDDCYCDIDTGEDGLELRILTTEKDLDVIMFKVSSVLKTIKAKVNNTCGLHVHIDMRQRDVITATKKLLGAQGTLFQMVPDARRYNSYCQYSKIEAKDVAKVYNKKYNKFVTQEGRTAINLHAYEKHKTIEVRLHEGTINAKEIINWCRYLTELIDSKKISKEGTAYARRRIKAFSVEARS